MGMAVAYGIAAGGGELDVVGAFGNHPLAGVDAETTSTRSPSRQAEDHRTRAKLSRWSDVNSRLPVVIDHRAGYRQQCQGIIDAGDGWQARTEQARAGVA